MTTIKYFSYGSNMSSPRLLDRVPSAEFVSTGKLIEHQLRFHKQSTDGSGKCDAAHTQNPDHHVWGVIFDISATEKKTLDRIEGLGSGYGEKVVSIILGNGEQIDATTYYAIQKDSALKPYHWYKEHVLRGARENSLPFDYISIIDSVASIPDPDNDRHAKELSIYR